MAGLNGTELHGVNADEFRLLIRCEHLFGEMLRDALEDERIPCALVPDGHGMESAFAIPLSYYNVYVPNEFYDRAAAVCDVLCPDPAEDLRRDLLENAPRFHVAKPSVAKKMRKALKLPETVDLFAVCEERIKAAHSITDGGTIFSSKEAAHYIVVLADGVRLMFNSETYELIYAKPIRD